MPALLAQPSFGCEASLVEVSKCYLAEGHMLGPLPSQETLYTWIYQADAGIGLLTAHHPQNSTEEILSPEGGAALAPAGLAFPSPAHQSPLAPVPGKVAGDGAQAEWTPQNHPFSLPAAPQQTDSAPRIRPWNGADFSENGLLLGQENILQGCHQRLGTGSGQGSRCDRYS